MEALRIVAMSGIMMEHFMSHAQRPEEIPWGAFYLTDTFFYVGLPVFFILSGHFGIRFSLKGLARLVLTILIFGLVNFALLELVNWGMPWETIRESVAYPVTGSPYWFMQVYVMLYVTAPLINAGLRHMELRRLRNLLILWLVLIYYADTPLARGSYMYGLYLYCIGYYCRASGLASRLRARWWMAGYVGACVVSGMADWWMWRTGVDSAYFHGDNNLLLLVGAVCLYLCFCRLTVRGGWIRSVAGAALGCYLLQDGWFGDVYFYKWQAHWMYTHGHYYRPDMVWMFMGCFVGIWVASWVLTLGIRKLLAICRL